MHHCSVKLKQTNQKTVKNRPMAKNDDKTKQTAFDNVIALHGNLIRRICLMYAQDSDEFDDLCQETMIAVWNGLDGFNGRAAVSTWIYRVAVNTCISWMRHTKRHRCHTGLEHAIDTVAADDTERRESLQMIHKAIDGLDALDKALVMLWLDDSPYARIAEVTGLSQANVATRLHRAKIRIKQNLTRQ